MIKELFEFKNTERKWHLAVLAGACVGLPIMVGYFTGNIANGKLASLAGLVILYIQTQGVVNQMKILMSCSFGLMFSFTVGSVFGFDPILSSVILGLYAFAVHLSLFYLGMTRPPGNFFFIMIAAVAICMPHDLETVPYKIGLIGIGTMVSCLLGLIYSLLTTRSIDGNQEKIAITKTSDVNLIESITFGFFVGFALLIGRLLKLENPYWIPTSCVAVMQGVSAKHILQRSVQRIVGTFIGLVMTWCMLLLQPSPLVICISIVLLQIVVEMLIVRNYGIAVIFITVLTIFLAESGTSLKADPNTLITSRFIDIFIGSSVGAAGGWILYNQRIHFIARKQIRKTKVIISKFK